jgi:hypothetical protein
VEARLLAILTAECASERTGGFEKLTASQFDDQKREVGNETKIDCENPLAQVVVDGESPTELRHSPNGRAEERKQRALDRFGRPTDRRVGGREGRAASKIRTFAMQMPLYTHSRVCRIETISARLCSHSTPNISKRMNESASRSVCFAVSTNS